ncbi:MAG TPA: tetraacyldisaccharide 4'-kinase [Flavobacterium sp.]|nr:tetraacyldisaccharide 4'-kinase [Flavobacterium sp.]
MKVLRFLLFPFGLVYWLVTTVRNYFYDKGVFSSYKAPIKVIAVGNLSVGGTGKTPQIEYLIRLLSDNYKTAILSRGYKRSSKGFVLADQNTSVHDLGDEPFQFFLKFKNVKIAVDANRKNGIKNLLKLPHTPEVILLDDAYQHRKVTANLYILLTAYADLYSDDFILPVGNLREPRSGAKRARAIIVTKCPKDISEVEKQKIIQKLNPAQHQYVFFTTINYDDYAYSADSKQRVSALKNIEKVVLAGIAKPEPFFDFLKTDADVVLKYPDHHNFSDDEIASIKSKAKGRIIVTTEKDYVRIRAEFDNNQLFYLPIKTEFIAGGAAFDALILKNI